jgi:hypothetical protein
MVVQTNPIRSGSGFRGQGSVNWHPTPSPWASAPNKPNFDGATGSSKYRKGKELWGVGGRAARGETKPIWRQAAARSVSSSHPGSESGLTSLSVLSWEIGVHQRSSAVGYPLYKQTQFAGHGRDGRGTGTPNAIDRVWEPTHGRDAHATERLAASLRTEPILVQPMVSRLGGEAGVELEETLQWTEGI